MGYKLFVLIFFFVAISCVDTHKKLFVLEVNMEELKQRLTEQKCHNKAIFIFAPSCPTCMAHLQKEYPAMQTKFLDSIDYVFISVEPIRIEVCKEFFRTNGIKAGRIFVLRENNSDYLHLNGKINISKTIQYLFANDVDIYASGYPILAMANKENKLKLEYYHKNDSTTIILPQSWNTLCLSNLSEIDFNKIDNCKN